MRLNRRASIRFHSTVWTCLELAVYSTASLAYPFSHGFRALLLADEAVLRHSAVREAPPKHPPANGGNASVQPAKPLRRKQQRHASFASTDGTTLRNHAHVATDWNTSLAIVQTRVKHHAHALSIDKFFSSTDDTNPVRQHPASSIANPACMYTTRAAQRIIHLEMRSFPVCFTLLADPDASISAKRDH